MNKGELIDAIAKSCDLPKVKAEHVVNSVVDTISGTLSKGGDVAIIGFGTFKVAKRAARTAKNPQTGATVKVAARKVPKFTPGKALKELVNGAKKKAAPAKAAKAPAKKGAKKR